MKSFFTYTLYTLPLRWKPEDADVMPSQQTVRCWLANIKAWCSTERMHSITIIVLTDATWKMFGHWQLECTQVRHFIFFYSYRMQPVSSEQCCWYKNVLVYNKWHKLFITHFPCASSHLPSAFTDHKSVESQTLGWYWCWFLGCSVPGWECHLAKCFIMFFFVFLSLFFFYSTPSCCSLLHQSGF